MLIAPGEVTQVMNLSTKGLNGKEKRPYKVVKLLNRVGGNAQIISVTDYQAREWPAGAEVQILCWLDVYNSAKGPGFNLIACKDQDAGRPKTEGNGNGNGKGAGKPY